MSAIGVNLRNLVYKLCEGREVPLLVTDMIAGYLGHRDFFNINTLSRNLNAQANAIIYENVVVDLDGSAQSITKASLLLRTLLTSQTAIQAIHTLALAGDPLQGWREKTAPLSERDGVEPMLRGKIVPGTHVDLTDFSQREIVLFDKIAATYSASMRSYISEVSVWALYLHILRLAPHIHDFRVSSDYFRVVDFRSTLQDMTLDSSMEKLRSCTMCLDLLKGKDRHASVVQGWDSALLALFVVPGIQSIATVVGLNPEATRQLRPGGSSVTRLVLYHYQVQVSDLTSLLAATPNLRYLEYHATTDYRQLNSRSGHQEEIPEPLLGIDPLLYALHHVTDSLQELHASQDVDEDSIYFWRGFVAGNGLPFRHQQGELATLKRLHTLTIPWAALVGWASRDNVWEWNDILPSSLRRIVLTDDLQEDYWGWTDKDLMPALSSLIEWLAAHHQGNEGAQFGMRLVNCTNEFNKPVRQELGRLCEERGIRCSIEKSHADRHKSPEVHMPRGRGRGTLTRGRGRGHGE